ncbi:MAG: hypothetical protein NZM26_04940 [Patescibacteria group bacterium]|nr:hypothetical protein [Patescibacteria group bacterium]
MPEIKKTPVVLDENGRPLVAKKFGGANSFPVVEPMDELPRQKSANELYFSDQGEYIPPGYQVIDRMCDGGLVVLVCAKISQTTK